MVLLCHIAIYSFLGFVLEAVYARLIRRSDAVRKCRLVLPVCPVYGFGAVLILGCPAVLRLHIWSWMLWGMATATAAEYTAGWFYETAWHVSFWDYSAQPWNLHGRICLPYSLLWGGLTLPLILWVQPVVERLSAVVPPALLLPMLMLWGMDFVLTGSLLRRSGRVEVLRWWLIRE